MLTQPFGQTLFLWRVHRGLTQAQLAARAKVARPNLSAIERGRREASLSTLRRLALALDVRPGLLVDGAPPPRGPVSLSRTAIERIADAVAFGRPVADPGERETAAALRTLLGHRLSAIRRRGARSRACPPIGTRDRWASRRAAVSAWLALQSRYSHEAIQMLADRVAERQRLHAARRD